MKLSLRSFVNFSLGADEDELGVIREVYFDDATWKVRFLVVDTGNWIFGRSVLVSPRVLTELDWKDRVFRTTLTKAQVENSPDANAYLPVSLQEEEKLDIEYYQQTNVGIAGAGILIPMVYVLNTEDNNPETIKANQDPHLRSSQEVTGYIIHATDGEIGHVDDFVVDTNTWKIDFIVVQTGSWLSKRKLILSPDLVTDINWSTSRIIVDSTVEQVNNSPEFDDKVPVNTVYEKNLRDYYGRLSSEP